MADNQHTAPGGKIRIDDLANPVLTDIQSGALAYAKANPVTLTKAAVLAAAQARTGLSDFGPEGFHERLEMWMRAAEDDAELSAVGRMTVFNEAVRFATARLYTEDQLKRAPEILQIEIDRPLIIAGLPRSGTTYLLQLMSADKRLRSLPHWEAVRPVQAPYMKDGVDTRYELCAGEWAQMDATMPYMKAIHEFSPDHISEDVELQCVDFGSYYLDWIARVPAWRDYYFSHDQTPVYQYVKKLMQLLSWQSGPNRWVTKCPQHMEQLPAVIAAFPDASVAVTHRDPVASIQSAITSIAYSSRLVRTRVDLAAIAEYWIDRYQRLLRACVRDHAALDPARSVDIYFHQLMADPYAAIESIYEKSGLSLDDVTRGYFAKAIEANARGRHGQLVYDLRGDFGINPEDIRKRFDFYYNRFPEVRIEVK